MKIDPYMIIWLCLEHQCGVHDRANGKLYSISVSILASDPIYKLSFTAETWNANLTLKNWDLGPPHNFPHTAHWPDNERCPLGVGRWGFLLVLLKKDWIRSRVMITADRQCRSKVRYLFQAWKVKGTRLEGPLCIKHRPCLSLSLKVG